MGVRDIARLARWLGPWAGQAAPSGVHVSQEQVSGSREFPICIYRPERAVCGSVLLFPGLHYAGPFDSRVDRFARILAHGGREVISPLLPAFEDMVVAPTLVTDAHRAFDVALGRCGAGVGVMGISFGVLPAAALAADRSEATSLILFGGYADAASAFRYCLVGDDVTPHDPLNRPALFINLLPHLEHELATDTLATRELRDGWRRYIQRTWGLEVMKQPARHEAIAREVATTLSPELQSLFLLGCGVGGGAELGLRGIERARSAFTWLDPRPYLARVSVPVTVVHGSDDDVIPHYHAPRLARASTASPQVRTLVTGMYSHSEARGPSPRAALRELWTMVEILRSLDRLGR